MLLLITHVGLWSTGFLSSRVRVLLTRICAQALHLALLCGTQNLLVLPKVSSSRRWIVVALIPNYLAADEEGVCRLLNIYILIANWIIPAARAFTSIWPMGI